MRHVLFAGLLSISLGGAEPGILRVKLTQRDGGKIVDIPVERYVAAVVGGESSAFRSNEALKAMAVAIRTYGIRNRSRHAPQGFDLCGTTHCQLIDLRSLNSRFEQAAESTAGEVLWYAGKPVLTIYSRDCGGRTEDAGAAWAGEAIPYLQGRADPFCLRSGQSKWRWIGEGGQIVEALRQAGLRAPSVLDSIRVTRRTASGRASALMLAGAGESVALSASSFRFAVGRMLGWNTVRSERWNVRSGEGRFLFEGSGSGHGAGLCQLGADQMGVDGRSYRQILAQYYPGAVAGITGRGLNWSRLGGERTVLMTTLPGRDASLIGLADRIARELDLRPGIELRVYPDIESFRNVTAEPGWVAAHTAGRRVHLQFPVHQGTLRHELLHIMVEERAAPNLPVWFREGLVEYLAGRHTSGGVSAPNDADLRQTADAARARRAYQDARRRVAALAGRYGEGAVLEWLKRGLPAEVAQASASSPPTKKM